MTANTQNRLTAAIEKLYMVFKDYPLAWWNGPYCCTSKQDEEILHSKPLQELTGKDLQLYEWHVFLCGRNDVEGYKHLLPRSFELLANGQSYTPGEVLLNRLKMAGWLKWPGEEKDAVFQYLVVVWQAILSGTCEITAEDWLVSLAEAGEGLDKFLEIWRQDRSPEAAERLAEIIADNSTELAHKELGNSYWEDHKDEMDQVVKWLLDSATKTTLEEAYFANSSESIAGEISTAINLLKQLIFLYPPEAEKME